MRRIARLSSVWYTLSFVQLFAVLHQCTLVPQSWVSPTKQINKIIVILQLCKNWSVRLMGSDIRNAVIFNDYKLKNGLEKFSCVIFLSFQIKSFHSSMMMEVRHMEYRNLLWLKTWNGSEKVLLKIFSEVLDKKF